MGPRRETVADRYDDLDFTEHTNPRWRVAGPDHLGLELRCYAHLVRRELDAWRTDRPDEATIAVDAERRFLADHVARWAGMAIHALRPAAAESPYALVLQLLDEFLEEEIDRLRPAPLLDTEQLHRPAPNRARLGPARLARYLAAPGASGLWLGAHDLQESARRLGFPWRPMDGRSRLRQLIESAADADELAPLLEQWQADARTLARWQRERAERQPGAAAIWCRWAARAEATAELLARLAGEGLDQQPEHGLTVRVVGVEPRRALAVLEQAGYAAMVVDNEEPTG